MRKHDFHLSITHWNSNACYILDVGKCLFRHWYAPKQHPLITAKKESEQRLLCGRSQVTRAAVPSRTHATAFQTWATGFRGVGCNILKGDIDFMYDSEENHTKIISRTAPTSELQHEICWVTQVSISGKDKLLWTA